MITPVTDLDEFFPTYLKRVRAKDVDGVGALYAKDAVWTCIRAPGGDRWAVGHADIVEQLADALQKYTLIDEVYYGPGYTRRVGDHAERYGTYVANVVNARNGRKQDTYCLAAFEVLRLDPADGWQYVSDHSILLKP